MHRVTVTLPDDIHAQLVTLAAQEGVSVSQYVAYSIAQQLDSIQPLDRLKDEASAKSADASSVGVASSFGSGVSVEAQAEGHSAKAQKEDL